MSVESVLARVATIEQALANPASLLATAARTGGTAAPAQTGTEPTAPAGSPSFAEVLQSASANSEGAATATDATPPTTPYTDPNTPAYPGSATTDLIAPTSYPLGTGASYPLETGAGAPGVPVGALGTPDSAGGAGEQIVRIAESQLGQTEQPPGSNESPAIAGYRTATAGAIPGAPWCAYFASWAARQAGEPLGANGEGLGSVAQVSSWAQSTGRAIPNGPGVTPQPGDLIVFGDEHVGIVREVLPNGDIATIEGNYENKVAANVRTPTEATSYVNMN
jgi:hypothetical protein